MVFHKELVIDGLNQSVNGKLIKDLDPDYQPMYYSYSLINEQTNQQKLAQVQNNHIYLIDDNELNKQIINPINKEQKFFVNAIINGHYDIMAIDAKAGSGKTLLSLATAMRLIKNKNTNYNNIIYIRNSIESLDKGEDIGYLPGLEEKFKIYNHPLMDNLKFIARSELQKRKQNTPKSNLNNILEEDVELRVSKYIRDYNIETMWVGEMRGRTLSNAFVIIDEAQNMSAKTLQLILSRVDKTCKVIVIGSNKQIDNLYINKYINGLSKLLKAANESHEEVNLWAGELNKVVRGPVTEFAERIFSK
jgi:PhoH-like ATPase